VLIPDENQKICVEIPDNIQGPIRDQFGQMDRRGARRSPDSAAGAQQQATDGQPAAAAVAAADEKRTTP